jgi:transposase
MGFNISMRYRMGRSLSGTRAVQIVPALRSRNLSICCIMNKNGTLFYKIQDRPFNAATFKLFIEEVLVKLRERNITRASLVMDNVAFHRVQTIRETIKEDGHKLFLLPPYSLFLNPIENLFSQWKQYVKRGNPRNEEQLISLIEFSFHTITNEQCKKY